MESIFKRSLKNKTTAPIVDLFVIWEGKLQGLDHKSQVMSEFLGAEKRRTAFACERNQR